ncbi:MAG: methyltransferase domain-containing protein [Planctomycetia bacterium]|nr:methyltransferase domain-containing protein [Planctomycetia bacterium]
MSRSSVTRVLERRAGLEAGAVGEAAVAAAVDARRRRFGESVDAYAARVEDDAAERTRLVADLLVHETSFFRYPASFDVLAAFLAPRAAASAAPVRILHLACSTGQEPLSAAMAALEAGVPEARLAIDAVDVSAEAVAHARAARYEGGALRGLSIERRERWFAHDAGGWRALPVLRDRVRYAVGDALEPDLAAAGAYDVVFCRNLLVYLTASARDRVLGHVRRLLRADGRLFVGHAEVLVARGAGFVPADHEGAFSCAPAAVPSPAEVAPAAVVAPPRPRGVAPRGAVGVPGAKARSAASARASRTPAGRPPSAAPAGEALSLARAAADAGRLDEARARVEEALRRGPPSADAYHLLAVVCRAAGASRPAEEALKRALYLDPGHRDALWLAALAATERGDRAGAERLRARAAGRGEAR